MANEKKDHRKEILAELDVLHKSGVIEGGLASKITEQEARKEQYDFGYDSAINYTDTGTGEPRFTPEQFARLSIEDQVDAATSAFKERQFGALEYSVKSFKNNTEDILKVDSKYDPKLASIGNRKEIVESASEKYAEFIELYTQYRRYADLISEIEEGKTPKFKDLEETRKLASAAAAKSEYDNMIAKGHSEERAKVAAHIASIAGRDNLKRKEIKNGAEGLMKDLKRRMNLSEGETIEYKAAEYVGESLKAMIESGDDKREKAAINLYHTAQRGYTIGEQKFVDVYKKD